mmetsp:Transcript_86840/g.144486  ORF Transcript_86840/g.144486 Transcript_86840/m.144486 type:complete len:374 (+) Transcript_86840:1717-2838(+)
MQFKCALGLFQLGLQLLALLHRQLQPVLSVRNERPEIFQCVRIPRKLGDLVLQLLDPQTDLFVRRVHFVADHLQPLDVPSDVRARPFLNVDLHFAAALQIEAGLVLRLVDAGGGVLLQHLHAAAANLRLHPLVRQPPVRQNPVFRSNVLDHSEPLAPAQRLPPLQHLRVGVQGRELGRQPRALVPEGLQLGLQVLEDAGVGPDQGLQAASVERLPVLQVLQLRDLRLHERLLLDDLVEALGAFLEGVQGLAAGAGGVPHEGVELAAGRLVRPQVEGAEGDGGRAAGRPALEARAARAPVQGVQHEDRALEHQPEHRHRVVGRPLLFGVAERVRLHFVDEGLEAPLEVLQLVLQLLPHVLLRHVRGGLVDDEAQ